MVRMPAVWRGQPAAAAAGDGARSAARPPAGLGQDALLDFQMEVTLDGEG